VQPLGVPAIAQPRARSPAIRVRHAAELYHGARLMSFVTQAVLEEHATLPSAGTEGLRTRACHGDEPRKGYTAPAFALDPALISCTRRPSRCATQSTTRERARSNATVAPAATPCPRLLRRLQRGGVAFPASPPSTACCGSAPYSRRRACHRGHEATAYHPASATKPVETPVLCALSQSAATRAAPWAGSRVYGILPREAPARSGRLRPRLPCHTRPGAAR